MIQLKQVFAASLCFVAACTAYPQESVPAPAATIAASPDAIRGVHHVGITVGDIDETIAFYSAAVPYELIERQRIPASAIPPEILSKRDGEIEIALIKTPTVFLRLYDIDPDAKSPANRRPVIGPGYTHICFQSPGDAPKYDRFLELGLDMHSRGPGPVDLGGYGVTYAYGHDSDGIMIEMEQVAPHLIAEAGELGRKRSEHEAWVSHVANVTGDKAAMVAFYSTLLGYGPRREIPPTRRKTFDDVVNIDDIEIAASWFDAGNLELEFWHFSKPQTPLRNTPRMLDEIGYSSVVFEVTDLDGTIARLEAAGMGFATGTIELGGTRIRFARDPEGNLLALQERDPDRPHRSIEDLRWIAQARSDVQE